MVTFEVKDMSCGHCVGTITKAIQAADPGATVTVDLARHRVDIEPVRMDAGILRDAIQEAGYTPVPVVER
ncbi:MAG TPA: heavy-metal-associated domain-containing protein [Albitalea sp.]|jgi:copper chaperone|nr:heavy-metal-associated domain-containing protein [Albitalea sp.]